MADNLPWLLTVPSFSPEGRRFFPGYSRTDDEADPYRDFCAAMDALHGCAALSGLADPEVSCNLQEDMQNVVQEAEFEGRRIRGVLFPAEKPRTWFARLLEGEEGPGSFFSDDYLRRVLTNVEGWTGTGLVPGDNVWNYFYEFQRWAKYIADKARVRRREGAKQETVATGVGTFADWLESVEPESQEHLIVAGTTLVTLAVAARDYAVTTSTLRRNINEAKLKGYRPAVGPKNRKWGVSKEAVAALYPRRK